ncbi:hypothetical protein CK203_115577 [Vitis vinifera]|uniref:Reverse transcriptase domain-containing protein n=1 Tax=Vitis vinifera TaxID=29760 RepID=A0A438FHN5_VITVI|nr:hypothetical protein CK203_115577 [Vitis vinifera]
MQGGVASWSGAGTINLGWRDQKGPFPIRFENMWLKVDGFKELLRGWWQEAGGRGRANFRLATKMKVLKDKSKDGTGRVWKKRIGDKCQGSSGLRKGIRTEGSFTGWLMPIEEITWKRLRSMGVAGRGAGGERGVVNAFQQLLGKPFTEEEIHAALMGMNGDKALGWMDSCGLLAILLGLVKEEIVDMFKEFFEEKSFAKSLNSIFLVLIPKKGGPKKVLDKGLCGPKCFCEGRQILDASLIANESSRKGGNGDECVPFTICYDTIIFCEARQDHLTYLSWILAWFEATSGLKINLAKSEIIPVGEVEDIDELAVEIG